MKLNWIWGGGGGGQDKKTFQQGSMDIFLELLNLHTDSMPLIRELVKKKIIGFKI